MVRGACDRHTSIDRPFDPSSLVAPRRQHQGRYNSPNQARVDLIDRGPALTRSTRAVDPTPTVMPRHLQGKNSVEVSPTLEKRNEIVGFIRPDDLKG